MTAPTTVRVEHPPVLGYHEQSIRKGLGKRLLELRESRMLFRSTAAKLASVSKSHLHDIERKGTMPRFDVLIRLANTYGVSVAYLAFDSALPQQLANPLTEFSEGKRFR